MFPTGKKHGRQVHFAPSKSQAGAEHTTAPNNTVTLHIFKFLHICKAEVVAAIWMFFLNGSQGGPRKLGRTWFL